MTENKLSLGYFRRLTKDLPDDVLILPRFVDAPGGNDPGVSLDGFELVSDAAASPTTFVAAQVSLFYLDDPDYDADTDDEDTD